MRKNKPVSTRRSSFSLAAMLVVICLSFLGIIFISVIYIAKDYYAYNSVYAFFGIDSQTLLWLMGLPVGQMTLLRLLNFSHACFIVCSVMFAMSFSSLLPERVARFLGWLIGGPMLRFVSEPEGFRRWVDRRDMAGAGRVSGSPISQLALHGTDRSL